MAEFKGTKGEWKVAEIELADYNVIAIGSDAKDPIITSMHLPDYKITDEIRSDAQLISAAPDMLKALQSLENDSNHIPESIWNMVQNAIKKATV